MRRTIILFLMLMGVNYIFAQDYINRVAVEGVGGIKDENIVKARDEAIWDAQRKAIEKGVGTFLTSETIVENSKLITDAIYTQANGYIDTYEIVKEKKDDYLYYVTIRADVKSASIGNKLIDLGLIKKIGDPRVLVLIKENSTYIEGAIVEAIIKDKLIEDGYRLVDDEQVSLIRQTEEAKEAIAGNDNIAKQIAQQNKADIIIVGETFEKDNGEIEAYGVSVKSIEIGINLKGIKVDNGEMILSENMSIIKSNPASNNLAIKQGLEEIAKTITEGGKYKGKKIISLSNKIAKALLKKQSIQVTLYEVDSEDYLKIIDLLKKERTISNVFPREMGNGVGRIDIDYERGTIELFNILNINQNLKIKNITANKLEVEVTGTK